MSARTRLVLAVGYWSACAVLGMAAFRWWDGETWRQVAVFPLVMALSGVLAELRRRKREKPVPAAPAPASASTLAPVSLTAGRRRATYRPGKQAAAPAPADLRLDQLVAQARAVLRELGLEAEIDVRPADGCWLVDIDWDGDGDGNSQDGLTLLVSPLTDGVCVLDPHDENLTEAEWPTYLASRARGLTPAKASRLARRPRRERRGGWLGKAPREGA